MVWWRRLPVIVGCFWTCLCLFASASEDLQANKEFRLDSDFLKCLVWKEDGCHTWQDAATCLSSRDGRSESRYRGKPCVWCGGFPCSRADDRMCEAYGRPDIDHQLGKFVVAACKNGKPSPVHAEWLKEGTGSPIDAAPSGGGTPVDAVLEPIESAESALEGLSQWVRWLLLALGLLCLLCSALMIGCHLHRNRQRSYKNRDLLMQPNGESKTRAATLDEDGGRAYEPLSMPPPLQASAPQVMTYARPVPQLMSDQLDLDLYTVTPQGVAIRHLNGAAPPPGVPVVQTAVLPAGVPIVETDI